MLVHLAILELLRHAKIELKEVGVANHDNNLLGANGEPSTEFRDSCHQFSCNIRRQNTELVSAERVAKHRSWN